MTKSTENIKIIHNVKELRKQVAEWRRKELKVSFVPTMGALHAGHMSLVNNAQGFADRTIVSIFVNPLQFSDGEDLDSYPRTEDEDIIKLNEVGVQSVFIPSVDEMYRPGALTRVFVDDLSEGLCGSSRPELFVGVATVVTKLLLQCLPDFAMFGEKDYQQLQIIKKLVIDLDIPVKIIPVETVRESDGLAMSSRNAYLNSQERALAPCLYKELQKVAIQCQQGNPIPDVISNALNRLLDMGFSKVDYFTLCDSEILTPLYKLDRPSRLLVAACLGETRLIDNIEVSPKH